MTWPPISMPLIRVCAEKAMKCALSGAMSRPRMAYFSLASTTIDRPSGVSSLSEESCAASASSSAATPGKAKKAVATRLPSVIVPVLSRRSEEHTSELQSPCNLVCRLLLEKKNKEQMYMLNKNIKFMNNNQ